MRTGTSVGPDPTPDHMLDAQVHIPTADAAGAVGRLVSLRDRIVGRRVTRQVGGAVGAGPSAANPVAPPPALATDRSGRRVHEPELGRRPALDGVRGVALIAILFYHARFSWAHGAFLAVSTFFTLSGFLVTTLLLSEHSRSGTVGLRSFWGRRFRRLLPAAWLTLAAVSLAGVFGVWNADQLRALRGDVPAALGEVVNWHFVLSGRNYGDLFTAPSPLEHFWSLAIEEQFYLLFPLVLLGLMRWSRGRRWVVGAVVGAIWAASVIANWQFAQGTPSRAYFGTDTRIAEIAVGVLLALVMFRRWQLRNRLARLLVGLAGVLAMAVTLWSWHIAGVNAQWVYPGGLLVTMACSVAMIAAALQGGLITRVLAWGPFRALGLISYGVYLFHWPIFVILSPARTGLSAWPLFAMRVSIAIGLAELSRRFLEDPIRSRARLSRRHIRFVVPVSLVGTILALVVATANVPPPRMLDAAAEAPAAPAPPPPTRVLVVGDRLAQSLGEGLDANTNGRLTVTTSASPWCGVVTGAFVQLPSGSVEHDAARCAGTRDEWIAAEKAARPDVVIVWSASRDVAPRRLSTDEPWMNPGNGPLDDLLRSEVGATVDALAAGGAKVVWLTAPVLVDRELPPPVPDDPKATPAQALALAGVRAAAPGAPGFLDNDPARISYWNDLASKMVRGRGGIVLDAATQIASWDDGARREVRRTGTGVTAAGAAALAEWMVPTLGALHRSVTAPSAPPPESAARSVMPAAPPVTPRRSVGGRSPVRTLVVGDSVGLNVGYGLQSWEATPAGRGLNVSVGAKLGCAVARGGSYRFLNDLDTLGSRCDWAAPQMWPKMLADSSPDVVVVSSGIWEVADRLLPGETSWRHVGDPVFDQYYLSELLSAIDFLGSQGASVVLLTSPHVQAGRDQGFTDQPESQPQRMDRLNQLISQAASMRPGMATVVDFQGWLASTPGGELDPAKRDDGVHFRDDWVLNIGSWLGPQIEDVARRR